MKQLLKSGAPRLRSAALAAALTSALLAACGGGGTAPTAEAPTRTTATAQSTTINTAATTTHADAVRLLTQATFGPTDTDIAHAMAIGDAAWIDEQLAKPVRAHHLARYNADAATLAALGLPAIAWTVDSSFYQEALTFDDQLRQRVTFALSEIFVVSTQNLKLGATKSSTAASYLDLLANHAFGTYRDLLEAVTLHPAMGQYLDMMANKPENAATGRIPDQNYAREVMQLFSIGLVKLNLDGTPKLDTNGLPIPTYAPSDIDGLSRVFTGFSWSGPDTSPYRFNGATGYLDPNRLVTPMQPYPQYHSLSAKTFLGKTIPATTTADATGELKTALDTIAAHPNVGPFLSKQLIQRLVTSNPSPAYVARVANVFNDDGTGVRGNLKAVVRAILLDDEARNPVTAATSNYGKLREPVLRLTAYLRAYPTTSDTGNYLIGLTDDPGLELSQSPLRSRSVFNFYRPGYVAPGGVVAQRGLVSPELQIATETSVAGYSNFMQLVLKIGVGQRGYNGLAARPDVQVSLAGPRALANDSAALVNDTCARLIGDNVNAALKTQMQAAIDGIVVPALNKNGTNATQIDHLLWNRTNLAVLLALSSPEFTIQR